MAPDVERPAAKKAPTRRGDLLVAPMSFAEERIWLLHLLADGAPLYSVPVAFALHGRLDVDALEGALRVVFARQENLRASFPEFEDRPIKLIHPEATTRPLMQVIATEDQGASIAELIEIPFDLKKLPLLRVYLIAPGVDEWVLLINAHHIVFDDRSVEVFVRELEAAYSPIREGRSPELPELRLQYPDYAAWQRTLVGTPEWKAEEAFWKAQMSGAHKRLKVAPEQTEEWSIAGDRCEFTIGWNLMRAVRAASQDLGVTAFSFFLAAFDLALSVYSETSEVVVGVPVDNRNRAEWRDLIGFFVNTVGVAVEVRGDDSIQQHVVETQASLRGALANSELPFQRVVQTVGATRHSARNPLFDTAFAMRKELRAPSLPAMRSRSIPVHNRMATFELMMLIEEREQDGLGFLEFVEAIPVDWAERFAADYLRLLAAMAAAPGASVKSAIEAADRMVTG